MTSPQLEKPPRTPAQAEADVREARLDTLKSAEDWLRHCAELERAKVGGEERTRPLLDEADALNYLQYRLNGGAPVLLRYHNRYIRWAKQAGERREDWGRAVAWALREVGK